MAAIRSPKLSNSHTTRFHSPRHSPSSSPAARRLRLDSRRRSMSESQEVGRDSSDHAADSMRSLMRACRYNGRTSSAMYAVFCTLVRDESTAVDWTVKPKQSVGA